MCPKPLLPTGLSWAECKKRCPAGVVPACHNSEDTVTISGPQVQCGGDRHSNRGGGRAREGPSGPKPVPCMPTGSRVRLRGAAKAGECVCQGGAHRRDGFPLALHGVHRSHAAAGAQKGGPWARWGRALTQLITLTPDLPASPQVIQHPRPRSARWLSTSIPEAQWQGELARTSSAEYNVNNLVSPVLFQEALRHVPANAVVLEIAPHALLQVSPAGLGLSPMGRETLGLSGTG